MTLENENIFDYIIIKGDKYILKQNTPKSIIEKIKNYVYNTKVLYDQTIKIEEVI